MEAFGICASQAKTPVPESAEGVPAGGVSVTVALSVIGTDVVPWRRLTSQPNRLHQQRGHREGLGGDEVLPQVGGRVQDDVARLEDADRVDLRRARVGQEARDHGVAGGVGHLADGGAGPPVTLMAEPAMGRPVILSVVLTVIAAFPAIEA